MVASGQITPDEIYTHPHRSVIYRSIGDKPTVQVDTAIWPLAPGDRLIVCSDGLWEMIRNEGIQEGMMAESDPQALCDLLASRANAAGGDDNISVVVVQIEAV
jgi:protein phosphatase